MAKLTSKTPGELGAAIEDLMRNRLAMVVAVQMASGEKVYGTYEGIIDGSVRLEIDRTTQAVRDVPLTDVESFTLDGGPARFDDELR